MVYSIAFDTETRTLHLRLEGFWSMATLANFAAELLETSAAARRRHDSFAILSDSSRFPVQSPDVAHGFEQLMARGAATHKGPTAILVASVLNKMQVQRSMKGPRLGVFLSVEEARAWLAAERTSAETSGSRVC